MSFDMFMKLASEGELIKQVSPKIGLDKLLFPKQFAFVNDKAKRKAAICSRRAGKSTGCGYYMAEMVKEETEGDIAYVTLTRKNANRIMFKPLKKLNEKYSWGLIPNETDLSLKDPVSGNTIYCTGAHTEDEVEKLRGLKFKLIILDEVASFRSHLNYMIEEVLEPTLIDLDGTMALIGTPSANPHGNYFYNVTSGMESGWSTHKWTILDNPTIPHAQKWLQEYKRRKGWDDNHPIYLREWAGEWTIDHNSLVYKYDPSRNDFNSLPSEQNDIWNYVVGVDIGFDDAFTICVNAFSYNRKEIYTVYQYKKSGLIPARMAEQIKEVIAQWNPIKVVADHGGLGKAICEEFTQRYGISIHPAEKQKKFAYIEIANGDLVSGHVKIKSGSELALEMHTHQWNPDKPEKEDDRTPNDLCDAWLYSFRECKHFMGEYQKPRPDKSSVAAQELEADEILQKEIEAFERQSSQDWLEDSWNKAHGY